MAFFTIYKTVNTMKKEITWDFDISNEEEFISLISHIDSENQYTSDVRDDLGELYEDFLKLSKMLDVILDDANVNSGLLRQKSFTEERSTLVSSNDLKEIKQYVHHECCFIKYIQKNELIKLAELNLSRAMLEGSKNLTEFEENIIVTKKLVLNTRMTAAYLSIFISQTHDLLMKICLTKFKENNT